MKPLRVFIASAVQDLSFAQELRAQLAATGLQPGISPANQAVLRPGLETEDNTGALIEQADAVVVALSPFTLESPNARQEWELARRLHKPVLLLLLHSLAPADLLACLEPVLPGAALPPDGELLHWIDVRLQPTEAVYRTLAWLEDRSSAQHGLPPAPVEPARFYTEPVPQPARRTAIFQIGLAALGLPAVLGIFLRLAMAQLAPGPAVFLDQFIGTILLIACTITMGFLAQAGWNGVETFRRRGFPPGVILRPLQHTALGVAALLLLLSLASSILGKTALLHGALFPVAGLLWGLASAALAGGLALPGILARRSRLLRFWMPRLDLSEPQLTSGTDAPPLAGEGLEPLHPAVDNGNRPLLPADGARFSLPRLLRQVLNPVQPQPAFAAAPAGFGLIHALASSPACQVSVLSAPQDAPFARSLERYLHDNGLHVQEDVAEAVHAHVNARIHLRAPAEQEDGAVVLVLSPWTKENAALGEHVQSAQIAGTPILPVLLEDTSIPSEFGEAHWVDARRNLPRARQQVLEAVLNKREQASLPARPRPSPGAIKLAATQPRPAVIPDSVQLAQWGLFFSSVFKLIVLAILFPMALWMNPPLNTGHWLSAGLIFSVTYIQLVAVVLFFMRRLSYPWMLLVQGDCLLVSLVTLPFLQSDLFWPVSLLARLTLLFPLWEAAVFGWLVFVVEIREWALGGFWVRLRRLRISSSILLTSLVPLMIGLLFLLPVLKAGPAPRRLNTAGQLIPGETVLVHILPRAHPENWSFQGSAGDLVTIRVDGGFNPASPPFSLSRGSRWLADSRATLGGALVSSLRLPEDGQYSLRLANLPPEGLFRLSVSLERAPQHVLVCDEPGKTTLKTGRLEPGHSLGWIVQIPDEETPEEQTPEVRVPEEQTPETMYLHFQVNSLDWKLDPWITLYDSNGNFLIGDDDQGQRLGARIRSYPTNQPGQYYLLVHSQPGTSGEFELLFGCTKTEE